MIKLSRLLPQQNEYVGILTVDSALSIISKDFHTQAQITKGNASNQLVTKHTPPSSNNGTSFSRNIASDALSNPQYPPESLCTY